MQLLKNRLEVLMKIRRLIQEIICNFLVAELQRRQRCSAVLNLALRCGLSSRQQLVGDTGQGAHDDYAKRMIAAVRDADHPPNRGRILYRSPAELHDNYIPSPTASVAWVLHESSFKTNKKPTAFVSGGGFGCL
jgi:hypothetical protein